MNGVTSDDSKFVAILEFLESGGFSLVLMAISDEHSYDLEMSHGRSYRSNKLSMKLLMMPILIMRLIGSINICLGTLITSRPI